MAPGPGGSPRPAGRLDGDGPGNGELARSALQQAMTAGAGVLRSAASLGEARTALTVADASVRGPGELANLVTVGAALLTSATVRTESRGAHTRLDHPGTDALWRCRLVHGRPTGAAVGWVAPGAVVGTAGGA